MELRCGCGHVVRGVHVGRGFPLCPSCVALLVAGIVRGATASDDVAPVARLALSPVIARDYEGLALYMTF